MLPTLGVVTSDDPNVLVQLTSTNIKQEDQFTGTTQVTPPSRPATAAAGSTTQLARVEAEMKLETPSPTATSGQPLGTSLTPTTQHLGATGN